MLYIPSASATAVSTTSTSGLSSCSYCTIHWAHFMTRLVVSKSQIFKQLTRCRVWPSADPPRVWYTQIVNGGFLLIFDFLKSSTPAGPGPVNEPTWHLAPGGWRHPLPPLLQQKFCLTVWEPFWDLTWDYVYCRIIN